MYYWCRRAVVTLAACTVLMVLAPFVVSPHHIGAAEVVVGVLTLATGGAMVVMLYSIAWLVREVGALRAKVDRFEVDP